MVIYGLAIVMLVIFDASSQYLIIKNKARNILLIFSLIVLGLISGMRGLEVGADSGLYLERYEKVVRYGPFGKSLYEEIGFRVLNSVMEKIGVGVRGLFIFCSVILMVALYFLLKVLVEPRYWMFGVFLFVCGGYFFASMNIMRQYFAMAIAIFSILSWCKHKRVLAIVLLLFASFFHTAVLIIVLVPMMMSLLKSHYRNVIIAVLYLLVIVITLVGVGKVASVFLACIPHWNQYANSHWLTNRNKFAGLKLIIPNLLVLAAFYKEWRSPKQCTPSIEQKSNGDSVFVWKFMQAGALCYVLIFDCVFGIVTLTRMSEFFVPFYIPFVCSFLNRQKKEYRIGLWLLLIMYYLLLVVGAVFLKDTNSVVPYSFL